MNLKSIIKQCVTEEISGNQSNYKKAIVIKKESYGISVTPYSADGKVCGGGLLHYSYQDDQYSDAIITANYLKGKYPSFKTIDLIGSSPSQLIDPDSGESNQWDSFKRSEKDNGEHSHSPEMRVRSDEPQNDIDESQWNAPDNSPKFFKDIKAWGSSNLDANGRYIGKPMSNYGFLYKVGQFIPITDRYSAMATWNQAYKARQINLKMGRPVGFGTLREGFDPQSMGVNCPMQPGESTNPYKAMNDKMRTMEEDKKKTGILSPKGLATVEKWATTMDSRDAAKRIIDSVLRNKLGLTSDDLADTSTFADGLDTIEDLLKTRDYQGAYDVAKDTAHEMIEEEGGEGDEGGFGLHHENKSGDIRIDKSKPCTHPNGFSFTGKVPNTGDKKCKLCGASDPSFKGNLSESSDEDVDYVEYVSQRQGEEPFTLRTGNGQEKFEYVNGKYKSGKVDIAVYAFRGDVCYGYNHFRKMFNLSESDITSVRPRDNGANIPREPEDAPNQYTKTNSKMSNLGNLEESSGNSKCQKCKGTGAYSHKFGMDNYQNVPCDFPGCHNGIVDHDENFQQWGISQDMIDRNRKAWAPEKAEREREKNANISLTHSQLEESLPPNFPNKLYRKLKSEYPNNDKAVYTTAHQLSKKYGNKLNEIAEKSKCKCKNCGKLFEPHYGDYSKCSDCMK